MGIRKIGEVIAERIAGQKQAEALMPLISSDELIEESMQRKFVVAAEAGTMSVGVTVPSVIPETPGPERLPITESLLAGLDTAYQTYTFLIDAANSERAVGKGRNNPEQLEVIDSETIKAEVEIILGTPEVVEELEAEIDYFSHNAEKYSPKPGFDLVIVPEGLNTRDNQALSKELQGKFNPAYDGPYIRPAVYNDSRSSVITGKGYSIAFAPRHYNIPSGAASFQTSWMKSKNQGLKATQLKTASDAEALAQISNLEDSKEINYPKSRPDKTYFRRFDQAPHEYVVSSVRVDAYGQLRLDLSRVGFGRSARALVVLKA